jgi:hypothetical protein
MGRACEFVAHDGRFVAETEVIFRYFTDSWIATIFRFDYDVVSLTGLRV